MNRFVIVLLFIIAGCSTPPQKGGNSVVTPERVVMQQSDNPNSPTSQRTDLETKTEIRIPFSTPALTQTNALRAILTQTNTGITPELKALLIALSNQVQDQAARSDEREIVIRTESNTHHDSTLGSSWRDTARDLAVKMKAGLPLMILGLVFLAGAGALAYFGWWTKAAISGGAGLACVSLYFILPSITGTQWLMIILGIVIVLVVMLAIYYSYHKGQFDKNNDGIPDILQGGNK